jgi:membrane-associated protease RseP (regulator of RpoE activity)
MSFRGGMMSFFRTIDAVTRRVAIPALALAITFAAPAAAYTPATPEVFQRSGSGARARCPDCITRDSIRARSERLILRLDSLRYQFEHERLSESQRERLSEEMTRTVLALKETLDQVPRAAAAAQAGVAVAAEALRSMPEIAAAIETGYRTRGYLGVVFDGTSEDRWRNNERIVRFYGYPRIALVEPSSPAERAGILQGDTLLVLNGIDVSEREISLTKLLVPDSRITVRVRRDGYAKDFRVTVGEAPAYVISRTPTAPVAPLTPQATTQQQVWTSEEPRRAPVAHAWPGTPPSFGSVWIFQEGIGGAKVETITEGLGKAVGVKSGVLVIRAAPGTPAFESGLRDGDVIVSVAGKPVRTVREMRGVLAKYGEEAGVKLEIVRERKDREITLRWQ